MKKLTHMQRSTLNHFNGKTVAKYDCKNLVALERQAPNPAQGWQITDGGGAAPEAVDPAIMRNNHPGRRQRGAPALWCLFCLLTLQEPNAHNFLQQLRTAVPK